MPRKFIKKFDSIQQRSFLCAKFAVYITFCVLICDKVWYKFTKSWAYGTSYKVACPKNFSLQEIFDCSSQWSCQFLVFLPLLPFTHLWWATKLNLSRTRAQRTKSRRTHLNRWERSDNPMPNSRYPREKLVKPRRVHRGLQARLLLNSSAPVSLVWRGGL